MRLNLKTQLIPIRFSFFWSYEKMVFNRMILVIVGGIFSLMVKLSFDWFTNKRRISQLESQNFKTELNALKAQLNPHFLFNTLNSIYVQIDVSVEGAKDYLVKFSDLLRYQLYESGVEKIALFKEIDYIKAYIDLQKVRRENNLVIKFFSSPISDRSFITPLLLMPFVENAFKHVSNDIGKQNFITVCAKADFELSFTVHNSKSLSKQPNNAGIGLENVKRRLQLLYGSNFSLEIHDRTEDFMIHLKIPISEN